MKAILQIDAANGSRDEPQLENANSSLDAALSLQEELPLGSSLYRGITGIGWGMQLLPQQMLRESSDEFLEDLDELLADGIECTVHPNLDLINGIAGVMVYAMRRGCHSDSGRRLWSAIDKAGSDALVDWLSVDAGSGSKPGKAEFLRNLGVAHGTPGLLLMGAVALKHGNVSERFAQLLRAGLEHLWGFSLPQGDDAVLFPTVVGGTRSARLAWCYGAFGLAEVFRVAATIDHNLKGRFTQILNGAIAQFESGQHQIRDASLCHGYAGAAFCFSHFGRSKFTSPDQKRSCEATAHIAFMKAVEMNAGTSEAPRFDWWHSGKQVEMTSFLEGTPGVLLALSHSRSPGPAPWAEALGFYI